MLKTDTGTFAFQNYVCTSGYKWVEAVGGPVLVPNSPPRRYWRTIDIKPAVYREFASLDPTPANIQGFAASYGDLRNHGIRGYRDAEGNGVHGSLLTEWDRAIEDMHFVVGLRDAITERKPKFLRERLFFTPDGGCELIRWRDRNSMPRGWRKVAGSELKPVKFKHNNVYEPARWALHEEINDHLEKWPMSPKLTYIPAEKRTIMTLRPRDLLAVMWVQFAEDVVGKFELKRCAYQGCPKYFQPQRGKRALYHSDICRVRAWNERKAN